MTTNNRRLGDYPTPLQRRRDVLGPLSAMALGPIGDIGSEAFTAPSKTITWETSTDWDNAVSEDAVTHSADVISQTVNEDSFEEGLSDGDALPTPWQTDGSAVIDSSRASDGSLSVDTGGNSATKACYSQLPDNQIEEVVWRYNETTNQRGADITVYNENGNRICRMGTGNPQRGVWHGNGSEAYGNPSPNYDVWYEFFVLFDWATDEVTFGWRDRSGNGNGDIDGGPYPMENTSSKVSEVVIGGGNYTNGAGWGTGDAEYCWHDVVTGAYRDSFLTTASKVFSSSTQPDLQNLDYTLNGQNMVLDVIGSPGTASEEIVSQTLDGATSYTLSWTDTHTDFRVKINMDAPDRNTSQSLSRVELVG